jgi:kinesin family member C1
MQDVVGAGDQKEMVGQLLTRLGNLEAVLWEAEKARRRNHNELIEMKGNIRVFCRLRPCSGAASVEALHGDGVRCVVDGKAHDFFYDRCSSPLPCCTATSLHARLVSHDVILHG